MKIPYSFVFIHGSDRLHSGLVACDDRDDEVAVLMQLKRRGETATVFVPDAAVRLPEGAK